MWIARLKIALFLLFLAAPVAALIGLGSVGNYGGDDHPKFPAPWRIVTKQGALDRFGDAVLHRSPATKQAVRLRNLIGYRLLGVVDTAKVVSGEAGWLFYRGDFHGGCLDAERNAAALARLGALVEIGRAGGIDLIASLSPDKSTIYPEFLSRSMRGYWRCQERNVETLRRLISAHAPRLVVHADLLLAEKARRPDVRLYYTTDTHWTAYGGALALSQLMRAVDPRATIPHPQLSAQTDVRRTDMTGMLLVQQEEIAPVPDPAWLAAASAAIRQPAGFRTVVIRDSFYGLIKGQIAMLFPGASIIDFRSAEAELEAGIMAADRLIINTVERSLLTRLETGELGWDEAIPTAIVMRNRQRAESCAGFAAATASPLLPNGDVVRVELPALPAGRQPCLRLTLEPTPRSALEIVLPGPDGADGSGGSVRVKLAPEDRVVSLVLPDFAAGHAIQIGLAAGRQPATVTAIEVGAIDRLPLPSDAP